MSDIIFTRRAFLSVGISAGALVMAFPLGKLAAAATAGEPKDWVVSPLIKLYPDNRLEIFYQSPEMGQGVATSLPMLFAEEMDADWSLVSVSPLSYGLKRLENGQLTSKYIPQGAGGSSSTPRNWPLGRKAGAEARQILLQAGARYFDVAIDDLRTENSFVIHESGKRVPFGDLIELAAMEDLPEGFAPAFKARKDWKIIGTPQKQKECQDIVTGKTVYGIDADYPGVKIAVVARSPYLDGFPKSYNDEKARAVDGVIDIVTLERPALDRDYTYLAAGVAVVAESFWAAKKARDLLEIDWDRGPYSDESTASQSRHFAELLEGTGQIIRATGDFEAALGQASKTITRTYKVPFVAHAQLEPQNCIAHVEADRLTIIGPLQSPGDAYRRAEILTGIDPLKMDIKYTRLGGGFGRRLTSDHAAEAVAISKASGLPIKVMWTREDDMTHDFYRPAGHHQLTAGLDADGNIVAWTQRLASASKYYRRADRSEDEYHRPELYDEDFPWGLIDNFQNEYFSAQSGMPRGSWRAPAHTVNAFAIQSFLDEIADELGEDPLAFRLRLLGAPRMIGTSEDGYDTGRFAGVLKAAAELADWGRQMPAGFGLGLAGHFTFGGYCAHVAEVEMLTPDSFRVHKVFAAVDVGTAINPAGILSQMEGAINDGLSAALGQAIEVKGGQIMNDNFDSYSMMRMADSVPEISIHIVDSELDPSGIGEIPLPPLAPAVANALVRAGGNRLRSHPFRA